MKNEKGPQPNLTLEGAKELISKLQRKCDTAMQDKLHAQAVAFDLTYPEKRNSSADELKAQVFYFKNELERAIVKRDTSKAENECLRAENHALKLQLKQATKGSES